MLRSLRVTSVGKFWRKRRRRNTKAVYFGAGKLPGSLYTHANPLATAKADGALAAWRNSFLDVFLCHLIVAVLRFQTIFDLRCEVCGFSNRAPRSRMPPRFCTGVYLALIFAVSSVSRATAQACGGNPIVTVGQRLTCPTVGEDGVNVAQLCTSLSARILQLRDHLC